MAVVYIHRKETNNEIFYVGIGKKVNRAYVTKRRSNWWTKTYNKHGRTVEIIEDDITIEEARESEMALIELIGRKDLELGPLVNMTDGGELNDECVANITSYKGKPVIHIESGKEYESLLVACEEYNLNYQSERSRMRVNSYTSTFIYKENVGKEKKLNNKRNLYVKHRTNGEEFPSLRKACIKYGIPYTTESHRVKFNKENRTFNFVDRVVVKELPTNKKRRSIKVIGLENGITYNSVKEACRELGLSYKKQIRQIKNKESKKLKIK